MKHRQFNKILIKVLIALCDSKNMLFYWVIGRTNYKSQRELFLSRFLS